MKNIPFGLCSSVVAALVWLGSCGGVVTVLSNQLFVFKHEVGRRLASSGNGDAVFVWDSDREVR